MEFFQSVFSTDDYKYFLDDHPCPHVGLIGCDVVTRTAIAGAFAGPHYRPQKLRVSLYDSLENAYTKKNTITSKSLSGVIKLNWWKKHQERVLGCAVLLVDWDAISVGDRLQFESVMQRHLDTIKAHFKIPFASNTKIIIGLVCAAKSLSDPTPCGHYSSVEDAQSSLRSRLGLNDRSLLALYNRGMDQYSVQRLENMINDQVLRYHKDEISRLRKAKNEANDAALAAVGQLSRPFPEQEQGTGVLEAVLVARNRFKMAWHATVSKDIKLARRSWEKCYNALHSLPPPLSVDKWVIATIALWKLISDNFQKFSNLTLRDAPEAGAAIETDVQAFLIHLNWVVDNSFLFHGGPSDDSLAPRPNEPTPALHVSRLSDLEMLHVLTREWYMADFYSLVANRLEQLKELLPKPNIPLESKIVCIPAFHLQNAVKCLERIREVMLFQYDRSNQDVLQSQERLRPDTQPIFLGKEGSAIDNLLPLITTISVQDLVGRIKANLFNCIVWYQSYGFDQLNATAQVSIAEGDVLIGNASDALQRLNRLLKDVGISQWKDIVLSIHEVRFRAASVLMGSIADKKSSTESPSNNSPSNTSMAALVSSRSGTGEFCFQISTIRLFAHRDMLASLLFLLFHSSNNPSKIQRLKGDLVKAMSLHELSESCSRANADNSSEVFQFGPWVDITPITMAEGIEGSSGRGTIRGTKGLRLCTVTPERAVIFPLLKVYAHFTKPFVESWKGASVASSIRAPSSGLTLSFECNTVTPLRLYNVEIDLFRILPEISGGRRQRENVNKSVRLCWFGLNKPTHFIELSNKMPLWSTTLFSLPFLTELCAGTYELGCLRADIFVSMSNLGSVPSNLGYRDVIPQCDSFDNTAMRKSCGLQKVSGSRSFYASLPSQCTEAEYISVPVCYNFSVSIEDEYVSLFENYCFDSAENRVHSFLTSRSQHQQQKQQLIDSARVQSNRSKARSTSFTVPTVLNGETGQLRQRASAREINQATTGPNSSIAAFANVLLHESHRFGAGSTPGCFENHLHRPILRLTQPVPKLGFEAVLPIHHQILEGDDIVVPLAISSKGDELLEGRILISYIEDIVELVDCSLGEDKGEMKMVDITGTTPDVIAVTPVGYRLAEVKLSSHCVSPSPFLQRQIIYLRMRCYCAGFFELPLRLEYSTPRCATMLLMHMLRVHVCRPFISAFKFFEIHSLEGNENLEPKNTLNRRCSEVGFAETDLVPSTSLPHNTHDILPSEYMALCLSERQELLTLSKIGEMQRAFDRDPRMANTVVNVSAQKLLKAQEAAQRAGIVLPNNQFYHVDKILSGGQQTQVQADRFFLHKGSLFVVRASFINTIRCPLRVEKIDLQMIDGVSAGFQNSPPSVQILMPGEEISFALQIKCGVVLSADDCMCRVAVHVRRVIGELSRSVDPSISSLNGGGFLQRFCFNFPRVAVTEKVYSCVSSYPTSVFVGETFQVKVVVTNSSAVPSKKLRLHFTGPSLDRYFVLTGRVQTSFVVAGFGSTTLGVSFVPVIAGAYNLPAFELMCDDEILARPQDIHTVDVLPALVK